IQAEELLTQAGRLDRPARTTTDEPSEPVVAARAVHRDHRDVLPLDARADAQAAAGGPAAAREPQERRPRHHQRRPLWRGRGGGRRHGDPQDRRQRQGEDREIGDHRPRAGSGERRYFMNGAPGGGRRDGLLWRGLLILAVTIAAAALAWPPKDKINL